MAICGNKMAPYGTLYWNQFINKYHKYMKAIVQIPLGSSRHVTTRYLVRAFEHKEKLCRDVTRHVAFVGEHNVTRSSRQARLAQHVFRGVFTSLIQKLCWDRSKSRGRTTKLEHTSTTASLSSDMLEQTRLDTLVMTRSNRRMCHAADWQLQYKVAYGATTYLVRIYLYT